MAATHSLNSTASVSPVLYLAFELSADPSRRHGGIAMIPKAQRAEPLEIRLVPLVTVRESFEGPVPGQQPNWTHVYVHLPEDSSRPLHSARLVS